MFVFPGWLVPLIMSALLAVLAIKIGLYATRHEASSLYEDAFDTNFEKAGLLIGSICIAGASGACLGVTVMACYQ